MVKRKKEVPEVTNEDKLMSINDIKNKVVRRKLALKELTKKKKEKKEERKRRRDAGEAPRVPHTIESLRVKDETVLDPVPENEEKIEEVNVDVQTDEFERYFNREYEPKILITFSDNPHTKTRTFGLELCSLIPNSLYRYRSRASVKKIVRQASERNFSDVIIINEDRQKPNGLLIVHLPSGPTAYFRMSNLKITRELKRSYKEITSHRPEVLLNNFTTRLGTSVSRLLGSLFHYDPEFKGRRVVTFHNQRDYIFFRHHRYEFSKEAKSKLRELGPRFTLRLEYLLEGTFDTKQGDYEWLKSGRRHALESNRRKFYL